MIMIHKIVISEDGSTKVLPFQRIGAIGHSDAVVSVQFLYLRFGKRAVCTDHSRIIINSLEQVTDCQLALYERIEDLKSRDDETDVVVNLAKSWRTADYSLSPRNNPGWTCPHCNAILQQHLCLREGQ